MILEVDKFFFECSKNLEELKTAFKNEGFELYFVGGFVRSIFTGDKCNDIDLTTDATPEYMLKLAVDWDLKEWHSDKGMAHGTIVLNGYEVTAFRNDVSCNGRHATVNFTKYLGNDLARRDFTINAMAIDAFNGKLSDPFNGRHDIESKLIRAVGCAKERIEEDYLRALRAVRFAGKYNFGINNLLFDAIFELTDEQINILSPERIRDEFLKVLETGNIRYLIRTGLLEKIIPEMKSLHIDGGDHHRETIFQHCLDTYLHLTTITRKPLLLFAALIHDIGKPASFDGIHFYDHEHFGMEIAVKIMERLKFSNDDISYVATIIRRHMDWHFDYTIPRDRVLIRAVKKLGSDRVEDMFMHCWADNQANGKRRTNEPFSLENNHIYQRIKELEAKKSIPTVKSLAIDGNTLLSMGFKPGVIFSTILNDCMEKVIDGMMNDRDVLIKYIKENYLLTP